MKYLFKCTCQMKSLLKFTHEQMPKLLVPDVCPTSLPATTLFGLNVSLHIPLSHRRFQCFTQPQIEKSCRIGIFSVYRNIGC